MQTSQTGGQPYSDTSPYGECSLYIPSKPIVNFRQNEPLPKISFFRQKPSSGDINEEFESEANKLF